jgi:transposase
MIQITPQMRILLAVEPADFRRGIDGLAQVCRQVLEADPMSGAMFVFRNRRSTAVKILVYDGQGYWLCQKRLSRSKFRWWPDGGREGRELAAHELQMLLWNGDPDRARAQEAWRRIVPAG